MKRNIPELLAPAGGMRELKSAVENGADAVYLGGKLFNARMKADNFSKDELIEAFEYAHLRGVKVYVTLNTLVSQKEIKRALEYAKWLYENGADAIILQDFGLSNKIKEALPNLDIHLSTQGTVYNESGVKFAEKFGFKRTVLARETTLEEIKEINKNCEMEIEVFIHGALCICYSGQCHISRNIGGRSGNKGVCAQTCRLPFKNDTFADEKFSLSPKDLCTVDFIDDLCKVGVSSLKIEGRMKSPEYVAVVTRIYRKYLDLYKENGSYKVTESDRKKLVQIFNRGNFTEGYLKNGDVSDLIYDKASKHLGVYIGKVVEQKKKSTLIEVDLKAPLNIGDGIEIHSRNLVGNVITYIKKLENGNFRIGDIKDRVHQGDRVYKITEKELMKEALNSFDSKSSNQIKTYRKMPLDVEFTAKIGEKAILKFNFTKENMAKNTQDIEWEVTSDSLVEKAIKKPMSEERIYDSLSKMGEEPFAIKNIKFDLDEESIISISEINQMRRNCIDKLKKEILKTRFISKEENEAFEKIIIDINCEREDDFGGKRKEIEFYLWNVNERRIKDLKYYIDKLYGARIVVMVNLYEYYKNEFLVENLKTYCQSKELVLIPYVPPITKGNMDNWLRENIKDVLENSSFDMMAISNLGWIKEIKEFAPLLKLYADYGLNIYNDESLKFFSNIGFEKVYPSLELADSEKSSFKALGRLPLMITEHIFESETLIDRKNKKYRFEKLPLEDKMIIVPEVNEKEVFESLGKMINNEENYCVRVFV